MNRVTERAGSPRPTDHPKMVCLPGSPFTVAQTLAGTRGSGFPAVAGSPVSTLHILPPAPEWSCQFRLPTCIRHPFPFRGGKRMHAVRLPARDSPDNAPLDCPGSRGPLPKQAAPRSLLEPPAPPPRHPHALRRVAVEEDPPPIEKHKAHVEKPSLL